MDQGHFYYIKSQYFIDFPDPMLMRNKEILNGVKHNRPCFYTFKDMGTGLYWMIPISSKVSKYKSYYNAKINKNGRCDTILFGKVLGHEKAFLIQNMCPVTDQYIDCEYIDSASNAPVSVSGNFEIELLRKAQKVLSIQRNGGHLIFPNILEIQRQLLQK
nr:MAG TPA: hypothetical protein [Caudoviricetes sp.]